MPISIRYGKNVKITKCLSQLGMEKTQKSQNAYLNQVWKKRKNRKMLFSSTYGKNKKVTKCLSELGMKKMKKSQNVYLNQVWKNVKIAKCLSQLGMEKRKNRKMPISIRYGKT